MSSSQKKLMETWNKQYPVTKRECVRAEAIKRIQGNTNVFVEQPCEKLSL